MPKSHWSIPVATVAVLVTVIAQAIDGLTHWREVAAGMPAGVAALLAVLAVLAASRSARTIVRRDPHLLVPWACSTAATWFVFTVLGWLLGAWFTAIGRWLPFGLVGGLSVAAVLALVIDVLATAWTTALVLLVARGATAGAALGEALTLARRRFWRVVGGCVLGHGIVLLVLVAVLRSFDGVGVGVAALLAALAIAWNLLTATLLMHLVADDAPFVATCGDAFASARKSLRFLAPVKLLQLALLGLFVMVSHSTPGNHRTNWTVNANWAGTYPTQCQWYDAYRKLVEAEPCALLQTMLALALFVLALVVHLRAARVVLGRSGPPSLTPTPA